MQNVSIKAILRPDRKKENYYPVYIRVIIERKKIDLRVAHFVQLTDWLPNGSVDNNAFNAWAINQDIQNTIEDINKVLLFFRISDITINTTNFLLYYKKKVNKITLDQYIRSEAQTMNICTNRKHSYLALANNIEKYFHQQTVQNCDYNFLCKLENVFTTKLKFKHNTVCSNLSKLRAILNLAFKQKIIKENPFIHFKIKGYQSTRQFLTKNDVLKIEEYRKDITNSEAQRNIASIFLFLCYTGIRIGDFQKINFNNITDNGIEFIQHKTKVRVFVPLSSHTIQFIDFNQKRFTFYKISGQKINDGLKEIATKTKIAKPISCHIARHTFATLSLQLGLKIETISKLLGHTKTSTTMIYAKMLDDYKKTEFEKWENFC